MRSIELINDHPNLYKSSTGRDNLDILTCRLMQFSKTDFGSNQDLSTVSSSYLNNILPQWELLGRDNEENSACLCSKGESEGEIVKHVSFVRNKLTGSVARIGSRCIRRFDDDNEIKKEIRLLESLYKNHSTRVSYELAEFMARRGILTQLELALVDQIGKARNIEQYAIDTLALIKAKIAIERVPPPISHIAEWVSQFLETHPENPTFDSPYTGHTFVVSENLIDEYKVMRAKVFSKTLTAHEHRISMTILCGFYRDMMNVTVQPSPPRPKMELCQLEVDQINRCGAQDIIYIAEQQIERYLASVTSSRLVAKGRKKYTVLSLLLDAYHRFNLIPYALESVDGIREGIDLLEDRISKLSKKIDINLVNFDNKIKNLYRQNTKMMNSSTWRQLSKMSLKN